MANLKNTTVDDSGFLRLPVGDTAGRPGSPNGRQIRFNTETGKLEQFRPGVGDWIAPNNTGVIATGGDSVYDVDVEGTTYRVHVFTSTGTSTFNVLQGGEVEYLIVAGGGSGGGSEANTNGDAGGGGGAGGLLTGKSTVNDDVYSISVGTGGPPSSPRDNGLNGDDTLAFTFTAVGGGGGGGQENPGLDGASGGGGGGSCTTGRKPGGSGINGQGNDGGTGGDNNCSERGGAGGGGAGSRGFDNRGHRGGNGGMGVISLITGSFVFYSGGGAGGNAGSVSGNVGIGGLGGGGTGGDSPNGPGGDATPNTGGGGGAAGSQSSTATVSSGAGGSGIVVIRYPLRQENPVTAPGRDVQDGLVLDLDFAKPTVYNGSGSVVTDSRLNGLEGNLNGNNNANIRTHRSALSFTGNDTDTEIYIPEVPMNTQSDEGNTIEQVLYLEGPEQDKGHMPFVFWNLEYNMWYYENDFGINNGSGLVYGISSADSLLLNKWAHYITYFPYDWPGSSNNARLWINGIERNMSVQQGSFINKTISNIQDISIGGGFISGSNRYNWKGEIALTRIYNRELSDTEAVQRFNFIRWRFGL